MDKKSEILQAAFEHFTKRGYNVSMSDIARQVGLKTPSLYSHFQSKDEIILLTIEREIQKYYQFLDGCYVDLNSENLSQNLYTVFKKILQYFAHNNMLKFWRHILLIDQDELRKTCSQCVFDLEIYHVNKVSAYLKGHFNEDAGAIEGRALHFLGVIQAALEVELLFYESEAKASVYIEKMWHSYATHTLNSL